MNEFVTIPAIMFIVMVGFIIFLIAFNFYLFYKWGKSLEELDYIEKVLRKTALKDYLNEDEWRYGIYRKRK
jgi:Tfp pilus assembly protein PilO